MWIGHSFAVLLLCFCKPFFGIRSLSLSVSPSLCFTLSVDCSCFFFDVAALQHVAAAVACECGMEPNERWLICMRACMHVCVCNVYIWFDSFARDDGSFAGLLASLLSSYWGASIEDHCRINESTAATAALSNIWIHTHHALNIRWTACTHKSVVQNANFWKYWDDMDVHRIWRSNTANSGQTHERMHLNMYFALCSHMDIMPMRIEKRKNEERKCELAHNCWHNRNMYIITLHGNRMEIKFGAANDRRSENADYRIRFWIQRRIPSVYDSNNVCNSSKLFVKMR